MKNKLSNKPYIARTGKDIRHLMDTSRNSIPGTGNGGVNSFTQTTLFAIWKGLLGHENFRLDDDFFHIGGNSLKAVQMVSRISTHLKVDIKLADVFSKPSVSALSLFIDDLQTQVQNHFIKPQPRPARLPLSYSQERLWFIDRMEGSVQYHFPTVLKLKGALKITALQYALKSVVARHESLRSVIYEEGGEAYQQIVNENQWELIVIDGSHHQNDPENLQQYIRQIIRKPFNLSKDYMLRATLITFKNEEYLLVVTLHHIASDGWSLPIIVKEVKDLYESYVDGRPAQLPLLKIQYVDYAIWQRQYLMGEALNKKLTYWKNKLGGVATLTLLTDFPRPSVQSSRGANTRFSISKELTEKIKELGYQQGTTLFMTLLAAFKVLLYRYTGQQDICVGTPIADRQQQELEGLIGFFVNTLALRTQVLGDTSFVYLLATVKNTTIEAYEHQEVPFEKVVEAVSSERGVGKNPLFQVLLSMQNTIEVPEFRLGETTLSVEEYENHTSQLDIICNITDTKYGLQGDVMYSTDLYTEHTIQQMMRHFVQLLSTIVQSPHQSIGSLPMLTSQEEHQLLVEWNNTDSNYSQPETFVDLFEQQVFKTPYNIAAVFKDEQLSFQQLNERANQMSCYLKAWGVKEGHIIPVCIERSMNMLVAILGILKTGAAYTPIDPAYPEERISYLLVDTGARIVLSDRNSEANLPNDLPIKILVIDEDKELIKNQPTENSKVTITPQHLAYVIYTSGSTGKPKGVMIENASLCNYLVNHKTRYVNDEMPGSGSFIHLSYAFDASVTAILMPLIFGKPIVISSGQALEVFEDTNLQKYAPYDFIKITPGQLSLLQPKMKMPNGNLITSKLVIGGEALLQSHLDSLIQEGISVTIINEYGPTEATVGCSIYSFNTSEKTISVINNRSISIGRPIDNTKLYILDKNNALLPAGIAGELCISGAGLARGYLNQPALTAEKFVKNPFHDRVGSCLYKTGDIATWTADGNITYLGRKDEQVKIRGYRIELGEIESVLQECSIVKQAVVLAKENKDGSKRLVGYIVPDEAFSREELVPYLESRLPEYMIPVHWVLIEHMPLTVNGKIDRNALPVLEALATAGKQYKEPDTEIEKELAEIWKQLLDVEQVSVHDSFFELGGHSLMIIKMLSIIKRKFNLVIPIQVVFKFSTIYELAGYIELQNDFEQEENNSAQEENDSTAFELINI